MQLADKYKVLGLLKKCCCHLADTVAFDNAIERFLLADFISASSELKNAARRFIMAHYNEIKKAMPDQLIQLSEEDRMVFEFGNNLIQEKPK